MSDYYEKKKHYCEPLKELSEKVKECCEKRKDCCNNNVNVSPTIVNNVTCPCGTCPPTPPTPPSPLEDLNFCVPLTQGHKSKQSIEEKLIDLANNSSNNIPSVLGAYYFYLVKKYLSGAAPANSLETNAFNIFNNLSPQNKELLKCSIKNFEKVPPDLRNRLLSNKIETNAPITKEKLTGFVAEELIQRMSKIIGMDSGCLVNERAGLPRPQPGIDNPEDLFFIARIFSINNIRTNEYLPNLYYHDYEKEEFELACTPEACAPKVGTPDNPCPGNSTTQHIPLFGGIDIDYCLRVLEFLPGEAVTLKGVNFIDTNAKVHIEPAFDTPDPIEYVVDAKVCGDITTPVTEVIDGVEYVIMDSRVNDTLIFTLPNDIPEGSYKFRIAFQNNTGIGTQTEIKTGFQYLKVIPPLDITFKITFEKLDVVKETLTQVLWWYTEAGEDESAIKTIAIPIDLDLKPSKERTEEVRFNYADSGESYPVNKEIFKRNNIFALCLSIIGYEVDDEHSYSEQIDNYIDSIIQVVTSTWGKIAESVASAVVTAIGFYLGSLSSIASCGISLVIMGAIITAVACWAPADLIIEDSINITFKDFADLTNPAIPLPKIEEYWSRGEPVISPPRKEPVFPPIPGIEPVFKPWKIDPNVQVDVTPISKDGNEYVERRSYRSLLEKSQYDITLSYTRL